MSKKQEIMQFMNKKLAYLTAVSGQGEGKAMLAALRKGVGRVPGELPELFGIVLEDMPEAFFTKGMEPTKEEWACYTALTLFAMHQQGNDVTLNSMHIAHNVSIGTAMSRFAGQAEDSNAQKRMAVKLQALSTAKDMQEFSYHLKSIIQLLRSGGIALNYSQLAADIYEYQFPASRKSLYLKWGQDFYRVEKRGKNKEGKDNE